MELIWLRLNDSSAEKRSRPSDEDDEWFGQGICSWEHAYKHAWW